jgi:hypothetical protein
VGTKPIILVRFQRLIGSVGYKFFKASETNRLKNPTGYVTRKDGLLPTVIASLSYRWFGELRTEFGNKGRE